jgi:hypothetical protein
VCKKSPMPRWQQSSLLRFILPWSGVTTAYASSLSRLMASRRCLALAVHLHTRESFRTRIDSVDQARCILGALKFAVACICVIHIADRFRTVSRRKANSEILEAGLILIVAISIISVAPASFRDGTEIVREHTLPLLLAALANRAVHLRTQLYAADQKAPR